MNKCINGECHKFEPRFDEWEGHTPLAISEAGRWNDAESSKYF